MIHAENKFHAIVEYRDASASYPEGFYVKHLQTSKEEKLKDRVHCYEKKNLQFLDSSWRGSEKKCVKEIDILAYTDMSVEYPPTIEIDLRDNSIIRATD
jgi:hypothetical protein